MEKRLFQNFLQSIKGVSFSVTYWDGTTENYGEGIPLFKIMIREKIPLVKLWQDPSLALGEAFMDGAIAYEGDLQTIIETLYKSDSALLQKKGFQGFSKFWARENKPTSLLKQKHDIQHHYDLGNDFYELWLDATMSYSCAYFCSPDDSLEKAQLQKIDYVLKKLQLQAGESMLDIGSGWGWLIIRAAQQYGVKASGITLSAEQYNRTKQRIQDLGLTEQVNVRLLDYRTLAASGEKFDKVVSVGMVEHVGRANLPAYMAAVKALLKPQGLSLLHSITGQTEGPCNRWIEKYIFPGGYIPSLRELIWLLPAYDFHLLDVESLRLHYAKTLDHWAKNFEKKIDDVRAKYGERFVKMWRLYLNSCAASFRASGLDIHQIIFSRGLNNNLAMTRHHLYR